MFNNKLSIYIPIVPASYASQGFFINIFRTQHIGEIKCVDFIKKGITSYRAYIHFHYWFENEITHNIQTRMSNPCKTARLVYDDPHYWLLLPNRNSRFMEDNIIAKLMNQIYEMGEVINELNSHIKTVDARVLTTQEMNELSPDFESSSEEEEEEEADFNENTYEGKRYFDASVAKAEASVAKASLKSIGPNDDLTSSYFQPRWW